MSTALKICLQTYEASKKSHIKKKKDQALDQRSETTLPVVTHEVCLSHMLYIKENRTSRDTWHLRCHWLNL